MLMPHFQSVRPGCPGARPEPHRHLYVGLEDVQVGSKRALACNLLLAGGARGAVLGAGGCGPPPHRPLPPPPHPEVWAGLSAKTAEARFQRF